MKLTYHSCGCKLACSEASGIPAKSQLRPVRLPLPQPQQVASGKPLAGDVADWGPPLVLLARVYSVFLLTAGDKELVGSRAALPPSELADTARLSSGLLPALTAALWQVLWLDSAPNIRE